MGVDKYSPRRSEPEPNAIVRAVVAEVVPVEPRKDGNSRDFSDTDTSDEDGESTLRRLETAEKVAYERYVASGGSERAAICMAWYLRSEAQARRGPTEARQRRERKRNAVHG